MSGMIDFKPTKASLRERCKSLYNALPSELGRYRRHVDVIDQIEAFALEIRNEAKDLAEAAEALLLVIGHEGYAAPTEMNQLQIALDKFNGKLTDALAANEPGGGS